MGWENVPQQEVKIRLVRDNESENGPVDAVNREFTAYPKTFELKVEGEGGSLGATGGWRKFEKEKVEAKPRKVGALPSSPSMSFLGYNVRILYVARLTLLPNSMFSVKTYPSRAL